MKEMRGRKSILVGLAVAGAGILGFSCFAPCNRKITNIPDRAPIVLNIAEREGKIYRESKSYLELFISDYVRDYAPFSEEMSRNIKAYGGGEIGKKKVVEGYVELYTICLDTAMKNVDKELGSKELDELSDRLVINHKKMVKFTDLSLEHPAVKEGYKPWGKSRVNNFRRIIKENLNSSEKDFRAMVRKAYPSKKELLEELETQNEAEKELFRGFEKSLENRNLLIKLIGQAVIRTSQEKSWELNKRELNRFYNKDE